MSVSTQLKSLPETLPPAVADDKLPASLPSVPLTIQEQRLRQELRLDRDKARLARLEQTIREDLQRLDIYKRNEELRGPDASAVRLVVSDPAELLAGRLRVHLRCGRTEIRHQK